MKLFVSTLVAGAVLAFGGTAAAEGPTYFSVGAQAFGSYRHEWKDTGDAGAFNLDRAILRTAFTWEERAGVQLNLETVRSAGPDSLLGVEGNSLLVRVRYGYGWYEHGLGGHSLRAEAGMIPDVWLRRMSASYDLRDLGALGVEQSRFVSASDLGAMVGWRAPDGIASAAVSVTNGQGYTDVERNAGKDVTAVASVRVLRLPIAGEEGALLLHGGGRDGSVGFASGRDHRVLGALTATHSRLSFGTQIAYAWGWNGHPETRAFLTETWLSGSILQPWLGAALRFETLDPDVDAGGDRHMRWTGALYTDLFPSNVLAQGQRVRFYAAYSHDQGASLGGPVPGFPGAANGNTLFFVLSVAGTADISLQGKAKAGAPGSEGTRW